MQEKANSVKIWKQLTKLFKYGILILVLRKSNTFEGLASTYLDTAETTLRESITVVNEAVEE